MRLLVDSNSVSSPSVLRYLARSRHHRICIADYVAMEIHKPDAHVSLARSLLPLKPYRWQVDILKSTGEVASKCRCLKGLQRRAIDKSSTRNFPKYLSDVERALGGDRNGIAQFRRMRDEAVAALDHAGDQWRRITDLYMGIQMDLTASELKRIRKAKPTDSVLSKKIAATTGRVAKQIVDQNSDILPYPEITELSTSFAFRASLIQHLHYVEWIINGSPPNVSEAKRKNDAIDNMIIATATYFDGFFSSDQRSKERYRSAKFILAGVRAIEVSQKDLMKFDKEVV